MTEARSEHPPAEEAARRIIDWDKRSTRGPGLSVSVHAALVEDALPSPPVAEGE